MSHEPLDPCLYDDIYAILPPLTTFGISETLVLFVMMVEVAFPGMILDSA